MLIFLRVWWACDGGMDGMWVFWKKWIELDLLLSPLFAGVKALICMDGL